jgi:serine/threonine protein kinase
MIKRRKRLTEPEASYLIKQLLESVQYIHNENVIHRDLKLGNLFIDRNLNVKVGDFGLATRLEDKNEKRKTICGTPNYIAPEVIQNDKAKRGHSFEVDVWSMGVILYTILIGKPPYEARDVKATYQRILNNEYSFPSHVPISDQSRDLIESMLQSDPKHRYGFMQVLRVSTLRFKL